jgi:hypothetical protein
MLSAMNRSPRTNCRPELGSQGSRVMFFCRVSRDANLSGNFRETVPNGIEWYGETTLHYSFNMLQKALNCIWPFGNIYVRL